MHAFRFSTEGRTRDAYNGPWFNDGMASVSENGGWDEGDRLITDYVAPSMAGAIFSFIQKNNDPRYSQVEWGSGRDCWISRLRGLSFSAVMSTPWKLGPASEASLGNVQLHEYPGFTGLVARSRTTRYVALVYGTSSKRICDGNGRRVGFVIYRALAWRIGNLEYAHSWLPNVDPIHASEGVRFTSGLTLRVGTW